MSKIISLLERIGQDANLAAAVDYNEAIEQSELSLELKKSLLSKDVYSLTEQLNVQAELVCGLLPAEEDEDKDGDDEEDKPTEEKASQLEFV
ncbi:hypothetical protein Q4601_19240 [Shewanella sp. 1_MG-2023]|uniref:hypothetical protein n=1 Tax=unclassified Shewanella TaxID=196818 RepID=UPI0026E203E1|nr:MULTISPECIES: hypothetical protein [unclassified Shewanella]MDO6613823.1 hypothetical protein [Shewanella sp. 7_MG-2023]MDO6773573.1 hypothetical protein [Shewanella sp. 2_MG-2023]MDO6796430.1 hypothetical protein [Shewanella sp. 1_MG-2023]